MNLVKPIFLNLPAILVLLPIFLSFAIIIIQSRGFGRVVFILTNLLLLFLCYAGLEDGADRSYVFGGWKQSAGIEFKQDFSTLVMMIIIYSISILFGIFTYSKSRSDVCSYLKKDRAHIIYALLLLMNASSGGLVLSNDFFNIYVFMEIGALTSYSLYAISIDKKAYIASLNYLITCSIATSIILVATGFILGNFGQLNIDLVKANFTKSPEKYKAISALYITGLSIKLGLFPFHSWKIKAYKHASTLVSTFMLPLSSLPLIFVLFKVRFLTDSFLQFNVLYIFASFSILFASISSLGEKNFIKLMILSSVSSCGFIFLSWIMPGDKDGVMILNLIIVDSIIKLGMLMIPFGLDASSIGSNNIRIFCGANRTLLEKITFCSIIFLLFNASGAPLTMIFFFKLKMIQDLSPGNLSTCFIILISSVIWFRVYLELFINLISPTTEVGVIPVNKAAQIGLIFIVGLLVVISINHQLIQTTGILFMKGY